jgi:hypothetical protein
VPGLLVPASVEGRALLDLWERGLGQRGGVRGDLVLRASGDEVAATHTVGERNVKLAALHARLFGPRVDLVSHCPSCGTAAQFTSDCGTLLALPGPAGAERSHRVESEGYAVDFRLPTTADVDEASEYDTEDAFAACLLERCIHACARDGRSIALRDVPERVLDAVSRRMEALDPAARLAFAIECPGCATRWDAALDVEEVIWTKLQAAAERLLLDVDTLARAYGWTERDVLALSDVRRAAYLQIVTG